MGLGIFLFIIDAVILGYAISKAVESTNAQDNVFTNVELDDSNISPIPGNAFLLLDGTPLLLLDGSYFLLLGNS